MSRLLLLLPALALLAGCNVEAVKAKYRARQLALDPPALWSIEVVPAQAGVRPVLICADSRVREGLARPWPSVEGVFCRPTADPVNTPTGHVQRCDLNGETWTAVSSITGDQGGDYTARFTASAVADDGAGYTQTRRFRRLGPCPAGWDIGDRTDQTGARQRAGL